MVACRRRFSARLHMTAGIPDQDSTHPSGDREPNRSTPPDPEADPSSPPGARVMRPWLPIAVVLTALLAVHATSLGGPFFWDDEQLILENPTVRHGTALAEWFLKPFWQPGVLETNVRWMYRPLTVLSYRLDWLLHGDNPAGYHLTNVFLHVGNALLLYLVAERLGAARIAAALAAALFGLLPRLTECSAWISGRTDMLALASVLGAFLLWPWESGQGRPRTDVVRIASASGLLLTGLLSKEVAAAGLLALLVAELHPPLRRLRPVRWRALGMLVATGGVYMLLRWVALGSEQAPALPGRSAWWQIARVLAAAGTYVTMILTPWNAQGQIGLATHFTSAQVAIGAALAALVTAAGVMAWRQSSPAWLSTLTMGTLSLLAVLHVVPLPSDVMAADRFLYVPMAALGIAAAVATTSLTGRRAAGAVVISSLIAAGLGFATLRRIPAWSEPVLFWVDACETSHARNHMPGSQLGLLLDHAGYAEEAIRFHANTLRLMSERNGDTRTVTANLAESLARAGHYDRAAAAWDEVTRRDPLRSHAWLRLGRMNAWQKEWGQARLNTTKALQLDENDPAIRNQLGALEAWEKLEAEMPDAAAARGNPSVMLRRARMLTLLGKIREAEEAWRVVLGAAVDAEAFREGTLFYAQMGEPRHADTALSLMAQAGDVQVDPAVRTALMEKAEEAARIRKYRAGIEACLRRSAGPAP